jgi:lipopolysaccharide transport system ATP-binding protein
MIAKFHFPDLALGTGSYSATVALHTRESHIASNFDWWDRALVFHVSPCERPLSSGVCNLAVTSQWSAHEAVVREVPIDNVRNQAAR